MKHLQPYTEFISESESRGAGVIELDWEAFSKAKRNRSVPLSTEDIAKLEALKEMTGGANRHEHLKNKSNSGKLPYEGKRRQSVVGISD
jgi:hypothetical protein